MEELHYLDAKLKDSVFCAIDLETTGINPFTEKIIEIGAVKFNLEGQIDSFEKMIDPCMPIPQDSIRIHGISDEMVLGCDKIPDIIQDLNTFLSDCAAAVKPASAVIASAIKCFFILMFVSAVNLGKVRELSFVKC